MTLEEIFEEWEKDSIIDMLNLGYESINIPKLHVKYYKMLSNEKLILIKLQQDLTTLNLEKRNFMLGEDQEKIKIGWKPPARGYVKLEKLASEYVEVDEDIVNLKLRIGRQLEKCQLLDSILKMIFNRSFQIRDAQEDRKYNSGM
jgi:Recombination, repair and ssDNA binding protein UvsY